MPNVHPAFTGQVAANKPNAATAFNFVGQAAQVVGDVTLREFVDALADAQTVPYSASSTAGWEQGIGTWTETGEILTRTTILQSSNANAAVDFSGGGNVTVAVNWPAEYGRRSEMGFLAQTSHDGTAAVTGVVGTMHVFTGLTADITFTLPATAALGDRVGVSFTTGSGSYEILLKSATGDKINNVDCSSTEWSRLFIAGETVIFRCIDSAAVDWVVEQDGRITCVCSLRVTTVSGGESAATWTRVTAAPTPGAWIAEADIGYLASVASGQINIRRAGAYSVLVTARSSAAVSDAKYVSGAAYKNAGETLVAFAHTVAGAAALLQASLEVKLLLEANDYLVHKYRTEEGGKGMDATVRFSVTEVL